MIRHFTWFEPGDGRVIKKITYYQQFRTVYKTTHRLKDGAIINVKSGAIRHTQESG
ncbi:MAG: type I restriction enzyme R subunit [Bradyrhizobium sp.]